MNNDTTIVEAQVDFKNLKFDLRRNDDDRIEATQFINKSMMN
jgi:hypothetical protein